MTKYKKCLGQEKLHFTSGWKSWTLVYIPGITSGIRQLEGCVTVTPEIIPIYKIDMKKPWTE